MTETPGAARLSRQATAAATAATLRSNQDVVFVDVGARAIESRVSRDGVPIVSHPINQDVLKGRVTGEPIIPYKVVGQSVAPGTAVPLGTSVDIVMVDARGLPVSVVVGTHIAFANQTMAVAYQKLVAGHPEVLRLVARAADAPLGDTDVQALREAFGRADVSIDDTPGRTVDAALTTLQTVIAFGNT